MMKKFLLLLCLFMFLFAPSVSSEQTAALTAPQADAQAGANTANYAAQVFDTADDAGRMTCRYLYLTEQYLRATENVRAGDSSVYTSPEGQVMVVDCGNQISGGQVVESLRAMGVRKIDIFVASHPHADHIGGFTLLADAFDIDQVYMNRHEYESGTYRAMLGIIAEKKISLTRLVEGDSFDFGPSVKVKCYNPPADFDFSAATQTATSIANEGSLCLKMSFGKSSFFTSGDMYIGSERRVAETYGAEIAADISKMNHHGDSTSNCTDFIQALRPKLAVAMNEGVLSLVVNMRYQKVGARTFYNCIDGAIKVSTSGDGTYEAQTQFIRELVKLGQPSPDGRYSLE